jgi:uncharacterized protein YkwD
MKKILIYSVLVASLSAVLIFRNDLLGIYEKFSVKLPELEQEINAVAKEAQKKILTPQPLIFGGAAKNSSLTKQGVIEWTNSQRANYGLPPLKENFNLDSSAAFKTGDMFANQYFAHDSPSGEGVGDLAKSAGYSFLTIGENLAMGNFESDESLVQAWMDSPGHRENILNTSYKEIGVSVKKGVYQGKTIWMAVQHFGRPLSDCNGPDKLLRQKIDSNKEQISTLQSSLEILKTELRNIKPSDRDLYTEKAAQYNNLVDQYNSLVYETRSLVDEYNKQVNSFNDCAAGTQ